MTPRRPLRKSVKTKSIAAELQFATDTLMVTFTMVVGQILTDRVSE